GGASARRNRGPDLARSLGGAARDRRRRSVPRVGEEQLHDGHDRRGLRGLPALFLEHAGASNPGASRLTSSSLRLQERLHEVADGRLDPRANLSTSRRRPERALALEDRAPRDEREEVAAQDRGIELALRLMRAEDLLDRGAGVRVSDRIVWLTDVGGTARLVEDQAPQRERPVRRCDLEDRLGNVDQRLAQIHRLFRRQCAAYARLVLRELAANHGLE